MRIFNRIRENCLILGAFCFFRKEVLMEVGGYSEDMVGEDMVGEDMGVVLNLGFDQK
jgi:hypothetical protein